MTSSKREPASPGKQSSNTNTPETISETGKGRDNRRKPEKKPADMFLKVMGIISAVGLIAVAKERGYLW
jgi:hypothetical protein